MNRWKPLTRTLLLAFTCSLLVLPAVAQAIAGFGPLDPTPPAGLTPEQIIQKFAARETEFKHARDNYTFQQMVKVDTINDDNNKVDGEYQQVTDITFSPDGRREEHVVFAPRTPSSVS